jgi:cobyrinic acid a,c-diamide synthase
VAERPDAVGRSLDALATKVDASFDLDAVLRIAANAPTLPCDPVALPPFVGRCRIAAAGGPAFTFAYRDNLDAFEAAGAEIVPFDPLVAPALPERVDGLLVGGGFPEVYGEALAANAALLADVRARVLGGLPTWAECGGLLWLAEQLDGNGMAGVVPATATLGSRLTLGYREAVTTTTSPIGPAGTRLRGHEFHYSTCTPSGDALELRSRFADGTDGFASPTLLATYLHWHAGGDPTPAAAFVRTCVS